MKGIKMPKFAKGAIGTLSKEAPLVMAIAAIGGVAVTAFTAFKASKKAAAVKAAYDAEMEELNKKKEGEVSEESDESDDELVPGEEVEDDVKENKKEEKAAKLSDEDFKKEVKRIKRDYIFGMAKALAAPVVLGLVTCGLIIGSHHVQARRLLYMTTAYEAATGNLKEEVNKYKEKLKEVVGEEKAAEVEKEVTEKVVRDEMAKNPGEIYDTGYGNDLFFDKMTATKFRADRQKVKDAFWQVALYATEYGKAQIVDFYDELGLASPVLADYFCFKTVGGKVAYKTTVVKDHSGEAMYVLEYEVVMSHSKPSQDYDDREIIR